MFAKRSLLLTAALLLVFTSCAPTPESVGIGEPNNQGGTEPPPDNGPGASSAGGAGEETSPPVTEGLPNRPWVNFASVEYKFSLDYPPGFIAESKSAAALSKLVPSPMAAFVFLSPELASSDTPELEPPDLDLRVFETKGAGSLEDWLKSVGLLNDSVSAKEFQADKTSGLEVCSSTMVFPGCSYFFFGNGWAYQLTPASLVGEEMINTFSLHP